MGQNQEANQPVWQDAALFQAYLCHDRAEKGYLSENHAGYWRLEGWRGTESYLHAHAERGYSNRKRANGGDVFAAELTRRLTRKSPKNSDDTRKKQR